jgi:hypothetical protein
MNGIENDISPLVSWFLSTTRFTKIEDAYSAGVQLVRTDHAFREFEQTNHIWQPIPVEIPLRHHQYGWINPNNPGIRLRIMWWGFIRIYIYISQTVCPDPSTSWEGTREWLKPDETWPRMHFTRSLEGVTFPTNLESFCCGRQYPESLRQALGLVETNEWAVSLFGTKLHLIPANWFDKLVGR